MKVGLAFGSSIAIDGDQSLNLCKAAETAGFESIWCGERIIMPDTIDSAYPYTPDGKIPAEPETPIPDPLVWLGFAAATRPACDLAPASSSCRSVTR